MSSGLKQYLDSALVVLDRFGIAVGGGEESKLAAILQDVVSVDEPKVLAIAQTVKNIGAFSELVRENVSDMYVGERYEDITGMFDSIIEDGRRLVGQLDDGKIDYKEKGSNLWMRLSRGSTHARFEGIRNKYLAVEEDTKEQLDEEGEILDAYINFRFALKEAEALSYEVKKAQEVRLRSAEEVLSKAVIELDGYKDSDEAQKSRLQLARDQALHAHGVEDRNFQLIKDVAECLGNGYNVGEVLVAKLKQTHDLKEQVYRRSVTYFTTNEHVFTTLDAVFTSQKGLHEATQTLEAMQAGANKGLEAVAELGVSLERAALKAGYGSTYNPESVKKLVDAVVNYQLESRQMIVKMRDQSEKDAKEIAAIVDDGKKRFAAASTNFLEYKSQTVA